MRAIIENSHGGPEALTISEVPAPVPRSHEVLIRVHAAGINRADALQRRGFYPPPAGAYLSLPPHPQRCGGSFLCRRVQSSSRNPPLALKNGEHFSSNGELSAESPAFLRQPPAHFPSHRPSAN